ncbi:hypothetical protein [Deinococcus hohokamensis]|uniref:YokE-like PH domain-containing protein n=1 Tax=Deinococcus hohokamensis TaxID=309883 RepID=A0ABV9I6T3_9DEIO
MTEPAPERALAALKTIGMEERPVASLEREDALFVLTGSTLLFQDGAGTRRVTLRDLTRIHSDQEGLLRVETPAGTALTASLLGFEPAEVQGFFAQVRDATARVKQLPAAPPAPLAKTFAPSPVTPEVVRPAPTTAPTISPEPPVSQEPTVSPVPPAPERPQITTISAVRSASRPPVSSDSAASPASGAAGSGEAASALASASGAASPAPTPVAAPTARPEPVIISSSGFSPAPRRTEPRPAELRPAEPQSTEPQATELRAETATSSVEATDLAQPRPGGAAELAAQAGVVAALSGRLRVLGMVLFVGAIALAFFQFQGDQRLNALWTLLAGGVGTVALTALSELARLLAALGRRLSGPLDEH